MKKILKSLRIFFEIRMTLHASKCDFLYQKMAEFAI